MSVQFDDMPQGSLNGWMLWAKSHGWGAGEPRWTRNLETGKLGLHVECAYRDECGGGELIARFRKPGQGLRYVQFMTGERLSK